MPRYLMRLIQGMGYDDILGSSSGDIKEGILDDTLQALVLVRLVKF